MRLLLVFLLLIAFSLACGSGPPLNPQTSEEDLPSGLETARSAEEGMRSDYVLYESSRGVYGSQGEEAPEVEEILEIEEVEEEEVEEEEEAEAEE